MGHPSHEPPSNFDALRIVAVGIVIVGNGLVLTGGSPPGLWGAPLPRLGLDLLFAIGGYMAVKSLACSASPISFSLGRIRRVFPALAISTLLTAFVIGPLTTTLPLRDYLLAGATRRYLLNALLLPHPFLPRTFEGQQWSGSANPMLWTLSAYASGCAAVLLLRLGGGRAGGALLCALPFAVAALAWPSTPEALPRLLQRPEIADAMPEMPFFFVAAGLSFAERRYGAALWRADLAMLCFALTWIVASWVGYWTIVIEWLTLPYVALAFGRMALPGLAAVGRIGNPSYGAYLTAFPLQQAIIARWPGTAHPILLCLAGAGALGLLSWHLIERPARARRAV